MRLAVNAVQRATNRRAATRRAARPPPGEEGSIRRLPSLDREPAFGNPQWGLRT